MKHLVVLSAAVLVILSGCQSKKNAKALVIDTSSKRVDTLAFAFVQNGTYQFARGYIEKKKVLVPKNPDDTASTDGIYVPYNQYTLELSTTDTLRDSLHHPKLDPITHAILFRKSFQRIDTLFNHFIWPLYPH